ncbi:hypothetical protein N8Y98_02745 [Pelagibacterales bacterium]|nr:hypothetical protein [Pelagibacterales bacterium]
MNEQLINLLIQNGMSPLEATMKAREAEQNPTLLDELMNMQTLPETTSYKEGGRVHLEEGGEADDDGEDINYQDIVDKIMASYPEGTEQEIERREPQLEALIQAFGPQLASVLGTPLAPTTGGENVSGQKYGAYAPTSADQNKLQEAAINAALKQAGLGTGIFGSDGQFTGITPGGDGIGAYQQYLTGAAKAAENARLAAVAGQGAGTAGIDEAERLQGLTADAAIAGQGAGSQALANAQAQANLMSQAGIAGQGAGDADFATARGFTGPDSFQQFMSPYQQEVIDTTMADYRGELQRQQAQLGLGAGSAFGGGRFGVAQGTLGAQGAKGMASQLAQLRQAGFQQANQLANQAYGQSMGLGQAAQGQASQNVGLLGQGLQGQQSMAQGLQQQAGQNVGLFGQPTQAALAGSQASQQQALQNLGLFGQAGQMQTGLASLQPQLAAQNIGQLGQLGSQQQQQAQARLDTTAQANKMIAFEPYDRMGFFGQQVAGIGGGYPGQTTFSSQQAQAGVNPMMQLFGIGASALGGIGNLASTFGYGNPGNPTV